MPCCIVQRYLKEISRLEVRFNKRCWFKKGGAEDGYSGNPLDAQLEAAPRKEAWFPRLGLAAEFQLFPQECLQAGCRPRPTVSAVQVCRIASGKPYAALAQHSDQYRPMSAQRAALAAPDRVPSLAQRPVRDFEKVATSVCAGPYYWNHESVSWLSANPRSTADLMLVCRKVSKNWRPALPPCFQLVEIWPLERHLSWNAGNSDDGLRIRCSSQLQPVDNCRRRDLE